MLSGEIILANQAGLRARQCISLSEIHLSQTSIEKGSHGVVLVYVSLPQNVTKVYKSYHQFELSLKRYDMVALGGRKSLRMTDSDL